MEAAHVVGLEAPAKGTLEPPVGSDLDGGGCPAALQGVSGPLNGGGEPVHGPMQQHMCRGRHTHRNATLPDADDVC